MDPTSTVAPPVVAVVVTGDGAGGRGSSEPVLDEVLDQVLDSLAAQDYPNLRVLVLDAGSPAGASAATTERVMVRLPDAHVRRLDAGLPFGEIANAVEALVEGAAFYCFVTDGVALDPSAVRALVEETYRSNAGIVAPKLVGWDDERRLEAVGFDADKFGTALSPVEPGELDQEQHDAVRDVFFLPSTCLLVRADLFSALGGFDPDLGVDGAGLDLCWRAHVAGGRVLVVPTARARTRSAVPVPGPYARLRAALSAYGPIHLARVLPQALVVTVVEVLVGLFTAKPREARDAVGAWFANLGHAGSLRRQRARTRELRRVPDAEIRDLQVRGSARLTAFFRGASGRRDGLSAMAGAGRSVMNNLRSGARNASFVAWALVLAVFVFGSRALITDRVPAYGSLVELRGSTGELFDAYLSGWWRAGLGVAAPIPTGMALLGLGSVITFGALAGLRTLLVLGPLVLGFAGMWRLTRPLDSQAARIVGLVVYAAVPLGYDALANGHWSGIIAYAATPWVLARLARATGLAPFGTEQGLVGPGVPRRSVVAQVVGLGLVLALAAALVPAVIGLAMLMGIGIVIGSLLTGSGIAALRALGVALGAGVVAFVLHAPWSFSAFTTASTWAVEADAPLAGAPGRGLRALLGFDVGPVGSAVAIALAGTAVLALLAGRDWRLAWAARSAAVALCALGVAWADDRGWLTDVPLPPVEVLLAPVAAGVALCAALGAVAFERDVRGGHLSWRQPLAAASAVAVAVGVVPVLLSATDGRWRLPDSDVTAFLPADTTDGSYRVLWLGDPRALPLIGQEITPGLAYAYSTDGPPDQTALWPGEPERADERVTGALRLAADGQTARLGTLLAPTAIRYLVVPSQGAPVPEDVPAHPPPDTLLTTLAAQLDLRRVELNDAFTIYENAAWIPARAALSPAAATAAGGTTDASLIGVDLSGSTPVLGTADGPNRWSGNVPVGRVYLSEQADARWRLRVDGVAVARSPAFGFANVFDVPTGGTAVLDYVTPASRTVSVVVQALLWLVALRIVTAAAYRGGEVPVRRRVRLVPARRRSDAVAQPGAVISIPASAGSQPERHWIERPPAPLDPLATGGAPSAYDDDDEALPEGVVPPEAPTLAAASAEVAAEDLDVVAERARGALDETPDEGDDPAAVVTQGAAARGAPERLVWHDADPDAPGTPAEPAEQGESAEPGGVMAGARRPRPGAGPEHDLELGWADERDDRRDAPDRRRP